MRCITKPECLSWTIACAKFTVLKLMPIESTQSEDLSFECYVAYLHKFCVGTVYCVLLPSHWGKFGRLAGA